MDKDSSNPYSKWTADRGLPPDTASSGTLNPRQFAQKGDWHRVAKTEESRTTFGSISRQYSDYLAVNSRSLATLLVTAFVSLLLVGCGGSGGGANTPPSEQSGAPTFEVDQTVAPAVATLKFIDGTGSRPVASIRDDRGNKADFVENEAIAILDDPSELDALLMRLNATVIKQINPPQLASIPADFPTFYLLRLNPATATTSELAELTVNSGSGNSAAHQISSQQGLDLLTAIARENETMENQLGANFLMSYNDDDGGLSARIMMESATGSGGIDYTQNAFQLPYMDRGSVQDIGAAEAMRLVHDAGKIPAPGNKIGFLIVDAGFSSSADYPAPVLPSGSALDVPNPYDCSSGNECPWHGTSVASTALSIANNGVGVAGPASEVALPIFVQSPNPNFWDFIEYLFDTLPAAIGMLPDIINISSSVDIPAGACLTGVCGALDAIGASFRAAGILVFASAGNNGELDIDDTGFFGSETGYIAPCEMPGVICVGGMKHASRERHDNSSYGSKQDESDGSVDIYAPYSVWVHDDPEGGTSNAVMVHGTSYSSPFAASIAALIKAADPSLGPSEIWALMRDNAHTEGGVGVHRWVNAYGAVRAALDGNAPPFAQITSPSEGAEYSWNAAYAPLYCDVDDDGDAAALSFAWSSNLDGTIGGTTASSNSGPLPSLGVHEITCTVTDGPYTVSDTISINVVNDPPEITITSPSTAEFFSGQAIALTATPNDINGNLAGVTWAVHDGATTLWSGTGTSTTIPAGTLPPTPFLSYSLTATATDTEGESEMDITHLWINPDPEDLPPSITNLTITPIPADDQLDNPPGTFYVDPCGFDVNGAEPGNGWCQSLTFSATIDDDNPLPTSGPPFDLLYGSWEIYRSGTLVSRQDSGSYYATFHLVAGNYRVVLTVIDSAGQSATAEWFFSVRILD